MLATNLHFKVQMISRGGGGKATASAAYRAGSKITAPLSTLAKASYRSGERLTDLRIGKTFDYTSKEGVSYTAIVVPDYAPDWTVERQALWNGVETVETRKDAQLARDIVVALPRTLTLEQQIALVLEFVEQEFTSRGMIADIAIHNKQASDGGDNPHVHLMLTTRTITPDGFGKKNRDWNRRELVEEWRTAYQRLCTDHLKKAESEQRISLESYATRGVNRVPGEHLGHAAWHLEQLGIKTRQGNRNRELAHRNFLRSLFQPATLPPEPLESDLREVSRLLLARADDAAANADIPALKPLHYALSDDKEAPV